MYWLSKQRSVFPTFPTFHINQLNIAANYFYSRRQFAMRTPPQTLRMKSWRVGVDIVSPGDATTDMRVSAATVILI
jgi:hypothetical protein